MTITFADPTRIERTERERSIRANWLIRTDSDGTEQLAQLFVSHSTGSRAFSATLYRVKQDGNTQGYMPLDGVNVGRERVARFSPAALESFFQRCLHGMNELVKTKEKAAAIFDPDQSNDVG